MEGAEWKEMNPSWAFAAVLFALASLALVLRTWASRKRKEAEVLEQRRRADLLRVRALQQEQHEEASRKARESGALKEKHVKKETGKSLAQIRSELAAGAGGSGRPARFWGAERRRTTRSA